MRFSAARLGALLLTLSTCANALHFYLDADEKRCFVEELPSDTVVEGQSFLFGVELSLVAGSDQAIHMDRSLQSFGMG